VRTQLLGAPRQLEAGVHRLAEHQALPRPLLLGRLQMVRRQHTLVPVGRQLVELFVTWLRHLTFSSQMLEALVEL
jgi:hypothetical protein